MGTTPREPETEAYSRARLHWAWFQAHPNQPMPEGKAEVDRLLLVIEAQAAAAERQRLADEVEGLPAYSWASSTGGDRFDSEALNKEAVLRLLRADGGAA